MTQFASLASTTELEAVNSILASVGEAPIAQAALDSPSQADVVLIVGIVKEVMRQTQVMGWQFNKEFGYEVVQTATHNWLDTDGVTTELGIYKPPLSLAAWEITKNPDQQGTKYVDTAIRKSRSYQETGQFVLVFYDREKNRDGFPTSERSSLYINPTWYIPFEEMPETARQYVTQRAARIFQNRAVGSPILMKVTEQDELYAFRNLKRDQGITDDLNVLYHNQGAFSFLGRRRIGPLGVSENRNSPNKS